uniref:Mas-related G-protein coupled receptor member A-like n=1 Tax=Phascolarctos cinereus TaxID=38626 RepID=A0A6P5J675_PHACI|nr:mas-related G-protein coupled receptor member A-like [Phascolarctos cinereus]
MCQGFVGYFNYSVMYVGVTYITFMYCRGGLSLLASISTEHCPFILFPVCLTLQLRVQCSSQGQQPARLYLLVLLTILVFLLCGLSMGIKGVIQPFGFRYRT